MNYPISRLPDGRLLRSTVSAQVYEHLLEALVSQQIRPGERLTLEQLAQELGVSHTPVRQALARLESEGIVRSEPHRGASVPTLDSRDIRELFEARLLCELFAVEKAFPSLSAETFARLRKLSEAYQEASGQVSPAGRVALARIELEFHGAIVALAANARISAMFRQLGVHVQTTLLLGSRLAVRDASSVPEHEAFLIALEQRDLGAAKARLAEHINNSRDFLLSNLATSRDS